jgi:uncharacterized Ntn-hydrolase superfamily protein
MMKKSCWPVVLFALLFTVNRSVGQDTFSIVAIDSVTGEVGSAGASCVDMFMIPGYTTDFLGDLIPGTGAINTQAAYIPANQTNARARMLAGDTPSQIISWLVANDVQNNAAVRQYGIAAFVAGSPQTAAHTGAGCMNYKNHITGPNYSIQGNILLGQMVLDSMEARFNAETGDLACKLMAALQGAKIQGADTRCMADGTSSLFAFVKVSQPSDPYGSPSFLVSVKTHDNSGIEPIDTLQTLFNLAHTCFPSGLDESFEKNNLPQIFPNPAGEKQLLIRTLSGNCIVNEVIHSGYELDLSKFGSGVYFLTLIDEHGIFHHKLVHY